MGEKGWGISGRGLVEEDEGMTSSCNSTACQFHRPLNQPWIFPPCPSSITPCPPFLHHPPPLPRSETLCANVHRPTQNTMSKPLILGSFGKERNSVLGTFLRRTGGHCFSSKTHSPALFLFLQTRHEKMADEGVNANLQAVSLIVCSRSTLLVCWLIHRTACAVSRRFTAGG